ncbi:hypothetical protein GQ42DRAFT_163479 [Ramicandelaber brevisporus]|nr:hypothetical protein GQ42DRAFT_163479 [Ramicandelaber brevisporus]
MCPADGQNATFGGCITELATYATETRNRLYEPLFITVAVEMVALIVSVLLIQARNTVERWKIRAARSFQPYQRSPVQEGQYSYMTN